MKFIAASFFVLSIFLGCKSDTISNENSSLGNNQNSLKIKYLALGDSYTIGTAIGVENSYANLLSDSLKSDDKIKKVEVKIIAKNGWTTQDLLQGISEENLESNFDMVSLLIGVNNQYQKKSFSDYRKEFKNLCLKSIALVGNDTDKIFVLSIPDWGVTPAGKNNREQIAKEIDQFNQVNREVCDSLNIRRFDITEISRTALNQPSLVASDGLHFSKEMHDKWVDSIYDEVLKMATD